jgi:hypothetical protein
MHARVFFVLAPLLLILLALAFGQQRSAAAHLISGAAASRGGAP